MARTLARKNSGAKSAPFGQGVGKNQARASSPTAGPPGFSEASWPIEFYNTHMGGERRTFFCTALGLAAILFMGARAGGAESEQELAARIANEQNPIRKAKYEIRLAHLVLSEAQDAYAQGQLDKGENLLDTFVGDLKTSWKVLQGSGRKAAKQPQGFRELEIALREDALRLQDMGRRLSYYDRGPVDKATHELDEMRSEVMAALFPGKAAAPAPAKTGTLPKTL